MKLTKGIHGNCWIDEKWVEMFSEPCFLLLLLLLFLCGVFFHRHWRFKGQQGKEGDHILFSSTNSARSQTFRHLQLCEMTTTVFLITTLEITRLLLNEIYRLIELLFDWRWNVYFSGFLPGFSLQQFDIGNRWIWTHIDSRPCITRKPTNQLHYSPKNAPS